MAKKIYKYIDDKKLIKEVDVVLSKLGEAFAEKDKTLHKNVIDPFSAAFDAAYQKITYDEWILQEKSRQLQKTFQNTVGYFHQHLIDGFPGWDDVESGGYDVENKRKKIIAEIKNKHNTMNSSSGEAVYTKMAEFLDGDKKGCTAYVVTIIPKGCNRFNKPFNPSVRGVKLPQREDIRIVDGATFYEIITGDRDALSDLYQALLKVLNKSKKAQTFKSKKERAKFEKLFTEAFGD